MCSRKKARAMLLCFAASAAFYMHAEKNTPLPHISIRQSAERELVIIESVFDYDLNPHTANYSTEAQILNGLYEGLFSYNPQSLNAQPALAETFKVSRNKLTWTFSLRSDAFFSDGTPITADVFREAWLALLSPKLRAPFASLLDCIDGAEAYRNGSGSAESVGITAKDAHTLTVKLSAPTEHLDKLLCHHAFSAVIPGKQIYSGAYVLESYTKTEIVLKKNTHYRDEKNVAVPVIRILLSDDKEENTYLFNTGNADWIAGGGAQLEKIIDRSALCISTQFGTEYLFFKAHREPWNNADARNALLYAVPWDELRPNNSMKAETLIVPLPGYPEIPGSGDYDIETAKTLLRKAGIENKKKQIVFAIPDTEYMRKQAELLKNAWKEIGVELVIRKTPPNRYMQSIASWNADLFSYTWIGDFADPLAFLELFRGGSSLNESAWNDETYNLMLEESSRIQDAQARYRKLAEAEQYLLDSGIILPVMHPLSFNIVDKTILKGWYDNALDIHPFKNMYFAEAEQQLMIAQTEKHR
ncbi:MAG: peptide ABC transporter substrate-binding protein [Bacteroides sp.]|nr:peptide ABC transporter substrate-binding protein [Prevotella sp.]MCM1408867.1 peptide ABC transporter substrate-binding protein [Treponema brennaborense]MCM1470773.1 peptide ABC transporter substrate-binding protein [Bacteroides sp.]